MAAKDLGSGKEQKIKIEASSGLSDAEIETMRKEAEEHAEEDKQQRELIDLRNQAEQTIYQTEKTLDEHKEKLDEEAVLAISSAKEALEAAAKGEDAEPIKAALEAYTTAAQKLAEKLYAQEAPSGNEGGPASAGPEQGGTPENDDIIDADFEVKS